MLFLSRGKKRLNACLKLRNLVAKISTTFSRESYHLQNDTGNLVLFYMQITAT